MVGVLSFSLQVLPAASPASPWADFVESDFPFFSSVVDARESSVPLLANNLTPRGLVLNLGHNMWVCFDTELLRVSAIWEGESLTAVSMSQVSYHTNGIKAPEGQDKLPRPRGRVWIANGIYPGWQSGDTISLLDPRKPVADPKEVGRGPLPVEWGTFLAVALDGAGVRLEYQVNNHTVQEWITAFRDGGRTVVQRRFRVQPGVRPLCLVVGLPTVHEPPLACAIFAPRIESKLAVQQFTNANGIIGVIMAPDLSPDPKPIEFHLRMSLSIAAVEAIRDAPPDETKASKRWPTSLTTRTRRGSALGAYVLDAIALPLQNPWKRQVRLADLTFFRDGRAAAVTFDGDVWIISGLGRNPEKVQWQRFASGLHEPLGICMREEQIYVFDRNGIWRLVDRDLDGEADRHELFSNVFTQTAETREFANGIRAAPDGTFVIGKGGQQGSTTGRDNGMILRVASDGRAVTVLGRGLRQPFLGMHPATGLVTASDQQGHYIPTTALHVIEQGNYYGFLSLLLPKERYPAPIADPLVWIPHAINASGAGQVWLSDDRMGPLSQGLIHLGYYRPEIFAVLMHRRAGRLQAAVVSLTRDLDFPLLNGAVNPVDGQLYVTGFQVWGTTARDVSGLARFRFTGAPSAIPREVAAFDKGILLRFEHPLDSVTASNPQNFSAERWNYVRTANYGSPHLRLDGSKGQETLVPSSAYLSLDGKSVFIGIRDMRPVMQMRFGWTVKSAEGHSWQQSAYFTPKMLPKFEPAAEGFGATEVDLAPRATQAPATTPLTVAEGQRLAELMGCVACHSSDGSMLGKVGPSWKGVYGSVRRLAGGGQSRADEEYLRESIREPAAKIVSGFDKSDTGMPSYEGVITEGQIEALILYLKTLR